MASDNESESSPSSVPMDVIVTRVTLDSISRCTVSDDDPLITHDISGAPPQLPFGSSVSTVAPPPPSPPVAHAVATVATTHLPEDAANSDSDGSNTDGEDYEAARLRNIQANNRMLAELGLIGGVGLGLCGEPSKAAAVKKVRVPPRKRTPKPPSDLPQRRSSRVVGISAAEASTFVVLQEDEEYIEPVAPPIGQAFAAVEASTRAAATTFASSEHLLSSGKATMLVGHKHDVYSITECPELELVVGGGKQGMVTFYPSTVDAAITRRYCSNVVGGQEEGGREGAERVLSPVLSVKVHSRWVSEVQYLPRSFDGATESFVLLSASDDRTVVASRFQLNSLGAGRSIASLRPESRLDSIHSGGIFSMHALNDKVATCSKDGTICLNSVTGSALRHESTYDGFTSGVLKCVRWQPSMENKLLASAGNDGNLNIFDCRLSEPTACVEGAHDGCANSVVFHPTDDHQLMSSGFDRVIRVWDLRNLTKPMAVLAEHHKKGKSLNRPCYLRGQPLTIGDGTPYLYVYDVKTAALVKQIYAGFTPSSLHVHPSGRLTASSGKNALWVFDPSFV